MMKVPFHFVEQESPIKLAQNKPVLKECDKDQFLLAYVNQQSMIASGNLYEPIEQDTQTHAGISDYHCKEDPLNDSFPKAALQSQNNRFKLLKTNKVAQAAFAKRLSLKSGLFQAKSNSKGIFRDGKVSSNQIQVGGKSYILGRPEELKNAQAGSKYFVGAKPSIERETSVTHSNPDLHLNPINSNIHIEYQDLKSTCKLVEATASVPGNDDDDFWKRIENIFDQDNQYDEFYQDNQYDDIYQDNEYDENQKPDKYSNEVYKTYPVEEKVRNSKRLVLSNEMPNDCFFELENYDDDRQPIYKDWIQINEQNNSKLDLEHESDLGPIFMKRHISAQIRSKKHYDNQPEHDPENALTKSLLKHLYPPYKLH